MMLFGLMAVVPEKEAHSHYPNWCCDESLIIQGQKEGIDFLIFSFIGGLWRELEREDLEGRLGPCESVCLTIRQNLGTSVSLMPCAVRF